MPDLTVTVDDEHMDRVAEVADALRARGLTITAVHAEVGIISGSVDAGKQSAVAEVPGVSSVEEGQSLRLPPPGSAIQ